MDQTNKSLRMCKVCGLSNEETKFQVNKRICIKCNSKKCNAKYGNEYFRKYMKAHYIPRSTYKLLENLTLENQV